MTDRFSFGVSFKHVAEDLDNYNMNAVLLDVGTFYWTGFKSLRFCSSLSHFGPQGSPIGSDQNRILDKINAMDATFMTTSPSALSFLPRKNNNFFIPNPSDPSFETLNNFTKPCSIDVFFALSHGVHRGILKSGKKDDRIVFLNKLLSLIHI